MTRKKERAAKRRKLAALRQMTVEHGCTPDEAANAAQRAAEIEAELGSRASRPPAVSAFVAATETVAPFYANVSSRYGAPMGRRSDAPEDFDLARPLHIQEIPFTDGDYDPGGAYWGGGEPIYCVWDDAGHEFYTRAGGEAEVEEHFPGALWIRHAPITCPRCGSLSVFTYDRTSGQMECLEFVDEEGNIDPTASGEQCHHQFSVQSGPKLATKQRYRRLSK